MKINIYNDIDRENFLIKVVNINGELGYLVNPNHIGCNWRKDNLIFRSSLWNSKGELISAGFKKFFNWEEQPDICEIPTDLSKANILEKLDGSLLIFSKYNGKMIVRTRGTADVGGFENAFEVAYLIEKYKRFFDGSFFQEETSDCSVLFEWLSPNNKIVIDYGTEPDMKLVGIIHHEDYRYYQQEALDGVAYLYGLERPKWFSFKNVDDMKTTISDLKDEEGVCVYYHNDQSIRKVKSVWYLKLHAYKNNLNLEHMLELYTEIYAGADNFLPSGYTFPSYKEVYNYITNVFDYECAEVSKPFISKITDASKEVTNILAGMSKFVESLKQETVIRKEQALQILSSYGDTSRSSMVFTLLDGKKLSKDQIKKLFYQLLKGEF